MLQQYHTFSNWHQHQWQTPVSATQPQRQTPATRIMVGKNENDKHQKKRRFLQLLILLLPSGGFLASIPTVVLWTIHAHAHAHTHTHTHTHTNALPTTGAWLNPTSGEKH